MLYLLNKRNGKNFYVLPSEMSKGTIVVNDVVKGINIMTFNLSEPKGEITIDLSNFSNGMYSYTLIIDGNPIETKKLVIIK